MGVYRRLFLVLMTIGSLLFPTVAAAEEQADVLMSIQAFPDHAGRVRILFRRRTVQTSISRGTSSMFRMLTSTTTGTRICGLRPKGRSRLSICPATLEFARRVPAIS